MKYCGRCKKSLDLFLFEKRGNSLQPWCKSCKRIYDRDYARNNSKRKEDLKKSKEKIYKKNRSYINTLKDVPCKDCGKKFPAVAMDFHHERDKLKNIGALVFCSFEKLKKELEKCIVLCSNCHRVRTFS